MTASLAIVARRFLFVREADGPNAGHWVSFFQRFTGNPEGDAWCASFVCVVDDIATKGKRRLRRTASTREMLADLQRRNLIVSAPRVDDLVFSVDSTGIPHHVAIVTATNPLTTVAGNTSEDGTSSNGTGVFEHTVSAAHKVYARLPTYLT